MEQALKGGKNNNIKKKDIGDFGKLKLNIFHC